MGILLVTARRSSAYRGFKWKSLRPTSSRGVNCEILGLSNNRGAKVGIVTLKFIADELRSDDFFKNSSSMNQGPMKFSKNSSPMNRGPMIFSKIYRRWIEVRWFFQNFIADESRVRRIFQKFIDDEPRSDDFFKNSSSMIRWFMIFLIRWKKATKRWKKATNRWKKVIKRWNDENEEI